MIEKHIYHSELNTQVKTSPYPSLKKKTAMPKARSKIGTEDEDIHGVINPEEAKAHVEAMEKLDDEN